MAKTFNELRDATPPEEIDLDEDDLEILDRVNDEIAGDDD